MTMTMTMTMTMNTTAATTTIMDMVTAMDTVIPTASLTPPSFRRRAGFGQLSGPLLDWGSLRCFRWWWWHFRGAWPLLADTIHNIGDAATAIPLWVAFMFARLKPSRRFPYGLGRVEDLAGAAVVMVILFSALVAAYEAIDRFLHPRPVEHLGAVIAASIAGFIGNEAVAVFRIKVGKEINSVALIADGYHARVDGWTSLAVLFGAVGVWLGMPLADPLVALGISAAIFVIVWQSAKAVFTRSLDGVEPEVIDEIVHAAGHVTGIRRVADVKARWLGHKLRAEVGVEVDPELRVSEMQRIGVELEQELRGHLSYLSAVVVYPSVE